MNYIKSPDDDDRFTMTLFLMRSGRPKYWDFHCPYCTQKVCELDGQLVHIRDVSHDAGPNSPVVRIRCPGNNKKWCRMWYAIQLSD